MFGTIFIVAHGEETCTFGRLFVSDRQSPKVVALDLDSSAEVYVTPDSAGAVNTPAIYPSSDAKHLFVNYRSAQGVVRIMKVGITLESHGDHNDVLKESPALLALNITGDMPTHFSTGFQKTVIFFDGRRTSKSSVLGFVDTDLAGKGMTQQFQYGPMDPQHGNAATLANDFYLVSQPNPGYASGASNDSLSVGFIVVDKTGKTVYDMNIAGNPDRSCPGYHGHAKYGATDVFGCDGGFLSVTQDASTNVFTSRQIKYHDTGSGRKTGTFFEHERQPIIVGQHSGGTPVQYSLIRWTAGSPSYDAPRDVLDFGTVRPCSAGFELALGKAFATLLVNGSLMVYDVASGWALRSSVAAVDPFSCTDATRPRIVMGYHRVFLLFPVNKEIVEYSLSLSTLTKGRTMKTTIEPAAGVVTGLSFADSAATACSDGVVLLEAEKAAAATKSTSNSTTTKSRASRTASGGGMQLLLSACMAGGLACFMAAHGKLV